MKTLSIRIDADIKSRWEQLDTRKNRDGEPGDAMMCA